MSSEESAAPVHRSHGQDTPEVGMLVSVCGDYFQVVSCLGGVWLGVPVKDRHFINPENLSLRGKPIPRPFLFEPTICPGCRACRTSK